MKQILDDVSEWLADGREVAIATVVGVEGSAPRDAGATMAVNDEGAVAGSVSGGCVEAAVVEEASEVLASGTPKVLTYGISDDLAFDVGLTCGGTIHILIERLDW